MEEYVQFTMRMEKTLYEELKESAQKNRRSIAKELEYITDLYINQDMVITLPEDLAKKFLEMAKNFPETK
ncbi:MAG: hypothetical protein NC191_09625 [Muribaculaceae bacterium]|nr:hypothetical protein [Muribaculaceae bacterium]